MKYRKKPVEAMRYDGKNGMAISTWAASTGGSIAESFLGGLLIPTLEGEMRADVGDWVIRGVKGAYYPCKPDIFEATYEAVESQGGRP